MKVLAHYTYLVKKQNYNTLGLLQTYSFLKNIKTKMFVIIGDNIFTAYLSGEEKAGKTLLKHHSWAKTASYDAKKPNKAQLGAALLGLSKRYSFLSLDIFSTRFARLS